MSKLSYEDKIEIYNKKKDGVSASNLVSKYKARKNSIRLFDKIN